MKQLKEAELRKDQEDVETLPPDEVGGERPGLPGLSRSVSGFVFRRCLAHSIHLHAHRALR